MHVPWASPDQVWHDLHSLNVEADQWICLTKESGHA